MINRSSFIYDYNDSDDSHDFKLTIEKDYTYTLYIKDYEFSFTEVKMKTYTGKWSHVFTYEYEYDASISHLGVFSKTKKAVLGIYLLEGYTYKPHEREEEQEYFGYEKSSGKGNLFHTNETIDEKFLKSFRKSSHAAVSSKLGKVELPGLEFISEKNK